MEKHLGRRQLEELVNNFHDEVGIKWNQGINAEAPLLELIPNLDPRLSKIVEHFLVGLPRRSSVERFEKKDFLKIKLVSLLLIYAQR